MCTNDREAPRLEHLDCACQNRIVALRHNRKNLRKIPQCPEIEFDPTEIRACANSSDENNIAHIVGSEQLLQTSHLSKTDPVMGKFRYMRIRFAFNPDDQDRPAGRNSGSGNMERSGTATGNNRDGSITGRLSYHGICPKPSFAGFA